MGQPGPVCNVDLWIVLLGLVDNVEATNLVAPSHTNILGNERVDTLAEQGRIGSLLCHVYLYLTGQSLAWSCHPPQRPGVPRQVPDH